MNAPRALFVDLCIYMLLYVSFFSLKARRTTFNMRTRADNLMPQTLLYDYEDLYGHVYCRFSALCNDGGHVNDIKCGRKLYASRVPHVVWQT